ncbi:toll/interleukin-1 receptor domain-containing protein, partial [Actinoplanes sp. NPDC051475]|uniref:toll/interleukin-1 receptor domain-containing protein n=1 Tax=Actinoplanes sp. NPDC051475 TaxID=3157225 RepID=UPI00344B0583
MVAGGRRLGHSGSVTARTPASACPASAPDPDGRVDVFVSHAGRDRAWAEWVAWTLLDAGYTVEL